MSEVTIIPPLIIIDLEKFIEEQESEQRRRRKKSEKES